MINNTIKFQFTIREMLKNGKNGIHSYATTIEVYATTFFAKNNTTLKNLSHWNNNFFPTFIIAKIQAKRYSQLLLTFCKMYAVKFGIQKYSIKPNTYGKTTTTVECKIYVWDGKTFKNNFYQTL